MSKIPDISGRSGIVTGSSRGMRQRGSILTISKPSALRLNVRNQFGLIVG